MSLTETSSSRSGSRRLSSQYPKIATVFDEAQDFASAFLQSASLRNAMRRLFPNNPLFFEPQEEDQVKEYLSLFHSDLPKVKWVAQEGKISLFLLCHFRQHASKFFYDMISRWLFPGRRLWVQFSYAMDFRLPDFDEGLYSFCEIVIDVEKQLDLEMIALTFPILEAEIRLGVLSMYHASRILEIKGLSADEKTSLIQERISRLVQGRPKDFDYDIFPLMQHFLVMCKEEFKSVREIQAMSRIICIFYFFRNLLRKQVENFPQKRQLSLKLVRTRLYLPFGEKEVIGIFVGINFLKENEVFEQRHLITAVQSFLPNVIAVEDSYFSTDSKEDKIHTMYLEIEKENQEKITSLELMKLKTHLPEEIKGRVEQLIRPVFMPRNEEEVMRNVVTLSNQLRYLRDIPQVILSFDEQTGEELSFTVILLRLLTPGSLSVQDLFSSEKTRLPFVLERLKRVGMIRKKYPKEAAVLRVRLNASDFSRVDHSVDLYKARHEVLSEVQKIVGDVRDYNGGMIAKQNELFLILKQSLGEIGQEKEFLLENFFYSLYPVEVRSVIDSELIKILFLMLLELMEKPASWLVREEKNKLLILMSVEDISLKQKLIDAVDSMHIPTAELSSLQLEILDEHYLGYIYFCEEKEKQVSFFQNIQEVLTSGR